MFNCRLSRVRAAWECPCPLPPSTGTGQMLRRGAVGDAAYEVKRTDFMNQNTCESLQQQQMPPPSPASFKPCMTYSPNEQQVAASFNQMLLTYVNQFKRDAKGFPPQYYFGSDEVKASIAATPIFAFLRSMPKGGVLHIHSGAIGT